jgi:hypothetical protein
VVNLEKVKSEVNANMIRDIVPMKIIVAIIRIVVIDQSKYNLLYVDTVMIVLLVVHTHKVIRR